MITLLTYFLLLFTGLSTDNEELKPNQAQSKYLLHGKLFEDVRSYGGMYKEYDPEKNTYPAHGLKLKVVRFDLKHPKVMGTIRSDVNGRFSIALPPGKYGFIGLDEKPKKGQFLPVDKFEQDKHYSRSSSWTANISLPIEIKDKDVIGVYLTNRRSNSCKLCPQRHEN